MEHWNVFQLFNKKVILNLGLTAGMLLLLFCRQGSVYGESLFPAVSNSIFTFSYWWVPIGRGEDGIHDCSFTYQQKDDCEPVTLLSNVCYYYSTEYENRSGLGTMYRVNIEVSSDFEKNYQVVSYDKFRVESDYTTATRSFVDCHQDFLSASSSLPIYCFATKELCSKYLRGEISATEALNYDAIIETLKSTEYNSELPYYDDVRMAVNNDKSVTYTAKMSLEQQDKIVSEKEYRMNYNGYAIYIDDRQMGMLNALVTEIGIDAIVNGKKLDEVIQFDESGRLCVQKILVDENNSDLTSPGHSGGGGRHDDIFSIASVSSLVALKLDENHGPVVYSFQRNLSSKKYLNPDTGDTSATGKTGYNYLLLGYYTSNVICTDEINSEYGYLSYSYQWLYDAFRQRYGSGTKVIGDSLNGNVFVDPDKSYNYDDQGKEVVPGLNNGNLNSDSLLEHINNGFGLLGTDGYIELSRRYFLGVPSYIWALIAMAMSVSILVIVFKSIRGM